ENPVSRENDDAPGVRGTSALRFPLHSRGPPSSPTGPKAPARATGSLPPREESAHPIGPSSCIFRRCHTPSRREARPSHRSEQKPKSQEPPGALRTHSSVHRPTFRVERLEEEALRIELPEGRAKSSYGTQSPDWSLCASQSHVLACDCEAACR